MKKTVHLKKINYRIKTTQRIKIFTHILLKMMMKMIVLLEKKGNQVDFLKIKIKVKLNVLILKKDLDILFFYYTQYDIFYVIQI